MFLKYLIVIMFLMTSSLLFAQLPKEIVVACHEGETPNDSVSYMYLPGNLRILVPISKTPTNSSISYTPLPGSFDYKKIKGSEERYEFDVNMRHFSIEDNQYFVRDNSWIKLSDAINHSNHPIAEPGNINNPMMVAKITFNKKDYLCISGSLCVNGSLAAVGEYYIVENAFDYDKKLQLYYYFFDKEFVEMVRIRDNWDG
ncbi:TPA: hypothetical protein ACG3NF_001187 [Legionella pneumophila]|uniref:Uncharacterized protein n=4 Tax=Legionella pneumophila TaxID=446 RepID=A0A378KB79_LEGPN|nr:hypothetical protein [Legionella pneumophila]MCO1451860.1 hypothetical protein [Legionella pneumophila]MCZ4689570.1 hypothetical protein [Legionella pneumophila]MCZ4707846.1 hypothetical protein [Legionella pneumophila]MCZ4716875.1 hypothetical protein [Legionella pneumophila]MCZ4729996.1 hypothetical protein [Legionella pneumophila]